MKMKISRKTYIISGVISTISVVVITLLILFIAGSADDEPSTVPPITDPDEIQLPYKNALVVKINNSTLWARDIDSDSSMYLLKNWTTPFQSFDFYRKKNIYFGSTAAGEAVTSYSKRFPQLTQPGTWYANKIAVDYVHDMVYVLDGLTEKINVFDLLNGYYNIISVDLYQPKDIAVDPVQRLLFILQSSSILTTNLDGSSPQAVVERKDISAFAIDVHEKIIYWSTSHEIQSADYEGQNLIVTEKINSPLISLAVSTDNLLWLSSTSDHGKPTLSLCKITNGTCENATSAVFDENAVEIKAYNFEKLQVSNPCNGMSKCEHMCVIADDKPRCVCAMGWQLNNESDSCEMIDEYLLYVQGDFVKGRALDFSEAFAAALLPSKINISLKSRQRVLDFDFDVRNREFVFSDDNSVSRINLKPGSQQILIGGDPKDKKLHPAVDWIARNVYYVRSFLDFNDISVRNIEPYDLSTADKMLFVIIDKAPRALVVHPNRGFLFVTLLDDLNKVVVRILRANLDGTNRTIFGHNLSISDMQNSLAIDYDEDRLFWFARDLKNVHSSDLEVSNVRTVDVSAVANPTMINIYGDYMYVSNLTTIWRIDKRTGRDIVKVLPRFGAESHTIRGAKVFNAKSQIVDADHPCAENNGGCRRYCFAKPKVNSKSTELDRVCECNSNEKLDADGKNCIALF